MPLPLLTSLLLIILLARLLRGATVRVDQPPLTGEILAGIILGPTLLGLIQPTHELAGISELAIFLIVMQEGLEMDFKKVMGVFDGPGLVVGTLGFLVPLACGLLLGLVFQLDAMRTVFLGLCISISAMPVAVRILTAFNMLDSPIGRCAIATGILNDIAALLALGVILDLPEIKDLKEVGSAILLGAVKLLLFALLVLGMDGALRLLKRLRINIPNAVDRILAWAGQEALFGFAVIFVMAFSSISENLGFHAVVGTFFGALLLSRDLFGMAHFSSLTRTLGSVSEGFLAPVFFTYLGLEFRFDSLHSPGLVSAVLVVAVLSKLAAGYWGGRLCHLSRKDSAGIGIILNGRGVMELVVANVALEKGFIGPELFSILLLMGLTTTLLTPFLFRRFILSPAPPASA